MLALRVDEQNLFNKLNKQNKHKILPIPIFKK